MTMKKLGGSILAVMFVFVLVTASSAAQTFNWRLASTWGEGSPLLESDRSFAQRVEQMSGGRINIKVFPAGQIGPANQVLDLVSSGAVEAGADWPNYWSGKNTVFDLLGSHVMGFTPADFYVWIYGYGGKKFYDEYYGKFNCVYFPHHAHDVESGIRSRKPLNSLADFNGLKVRMAGLIQGKLIQAFGAQPVSLALDEVYEAMQRGVVDACEISIPWVDETTKIYEVAQYWLTPGFHQTSSIHGILVNKKKWDELPDDLKFIVENAAKANHLERLAISTQNSSTSTEFMVTKADVKTNRVSEEDLLKLEEAKNKIMSELAAQNPDYNRVLKNQIEFVKQLAYYRDATSPWSFGRTWGSYPITQ